MRFYLRAKFEASSVILTSFRHKGGWGEGVTLPTTYPPQNEPLKSPPILGLSDQYLMKDQFQESSIIFIFGSGQCVQSTQ